MMNKAKTARAFLAVAGLSACFAMTAFGQSGMTPNADGSNPAAPTPAQKAQDEQRTQLDTAAALALTAGHYDQAVADAQQAENMYIGDPGAPLLIAQGLEGQGKWEEALKKYQTLVKRGDVGPNVLLPYALLLLNKGQVREALAAYEKALPFVNDAEMLSSHDDFSPDNVNPTALAAAIHVARSLLLAQGGIAYVFTHHVEYDQALSEGEKALTLAPNSALANYYHGLVLRRMGRKDDAKAAYQKAATLDPTGDVKAAADKALAHL